MRVEYKSPRDILGQIVGADTSSEARAPHRKSSSIPESVRTREGSDVALFEGAHIEQWHIVPLVCLLSDIASGDIFGYGDTSATGCDAKAKVAAHKVYRLVPLPSTRKTRGIYEHKLHAKD